MNFIKIESKLKNYQRDIKYSTHQITTKQIRRIIPNLSCRNYFHKSRQKPSFLRTMNQFNFDKSKFKTSSYSLFRSNDIDMVRNLNLDYMGKINYDSTTLRESIIKTLKNITKEDDDDGKKEEIDKEKQQTQLPKFDNNKPIEVIQNHKLKYLNEMSEQLHKDLISRLKCLRGETSVKKNQKNNIFKKMKLIEHELNEIDMENNFSKEKYKNKIFNIIKKTDEERKEMAIKNRAQIKLQTKRKKYLKSGGNILETFKSNKVETVSSTNHNTNNTNTNRINHNINTPSQSSKTNNKNNELKNNIDDNIDIINNNNENNNESSSKQNNLSSANNNISPEKNNSNKKPYDMFQMNILQTQLKKEFENYQNAQKEKKINLKLDLKKLESELNKLDKKIICDRREEKEIINKLMEYYKEILFKGKNVKKDGLVWIVKTIWYLGENVPISFMPQFLDFESIEYLFKLAQKQLEIEYFKKKVSEMKLSLKKDIPIKYKNDFKKLNVYDKEENENNNNLLLDKSKLYSIIQKKTDEIVHGNKNDIYRILVKEFEKKNSKIEINNLPEINRINKLKEHIEKIKSEILELKQNEIKRISKCFLEKNYEEKYHTNIETVLTAIVGVDSKDTEMTKYNSIRKTHISELKKIRFFNYGHTRRVTSK